MRNWLGNNRHGNKLMSVFGKAAGRIQSIQLLIPSSALLTWSSISDSALTAYKNAKNPALLVRTWNNWELAGRARALHDWHFKQNFLGAALFRLLHKGSARLV